MEVLIMMNYDNYFEDYEVDDIFDDDIHEMMRRRKVKKGNFIDVYFEDEEEYDDFEEDWEVD
jgi:hypothetical protein